MTFDGIRSLAGETMIRENAEDIVSSGSWVPAYGMVDKDRKEIEALKNS